MLFNRVVAQVDNNREFADVPALKCLAQVRAILTGMNSRDRIEVTSTCWSENRLCVEPGSRSGFDS